MKSLERCGTECPAYLTRCLPLTPDAANGANDRPDVHRVELLPSIGKTHTKKVLFMRRLEFSLSN